MSWIKDNKFLVGLGGGTLVAVLVLYFVGSKGAQNYDEAKEKFETAASEARGYEKLALYPKEENKDGKSKALGEYRESLETLQSAFEPYRPKEIKNITPQEFTTRLLAANEEVRKAFEESGTLVPEPFFLGFERYKTSLAPGNITGILDYQLGALKSVMLNLAQSKATELKNFHRPSIAEEQGQTFTPAEGVVARPLPFELVFTGPENSVREFLATLSKPGNHYFVVRSLRIGNMKKDPPRAADAQFDKAAAAKPAGGADAAFSGGFVLPGDEPAAGPAAAEEAPKPADSSRVLSQVLGNEQVQVFLRIDLLQFLPAKKLP